MSKQSNSYVYMYVLVMSVITALSLSFTYTLFKPMHDAAGELSVKQDILSAVKGAEAFKLKKEEVDNIYAKQIQQIVLDAKGNVVAGTAANAAEKIDLGVEKKKPENERQYPLFVYTDEKGKKQYILSVRGAGLWDEIWGFVALGDDANTVVGCSFDHKAETPGLGAEIKDNQSWKNQFFAQKDGTSKKTIFDASGEYVSVKVQKGGGTKRDEHAVDGITGATITSNGVTEMLNRGLSYYVPYLKTQRKS